MRSRVLQIGHDLQHKLKARVDKNQREYILREQLKLIREELGEDNTADTAEEYRDKLRELQASKEVRDKISKEIDRFKSMNSSAAESSVLSTYIETLLDLPWDKKSEDSMDLEEAWKILEDGHYGLKDVKERIMEFLAVRKLTSGGKSPILCLGRSSGKPAKHLSRNLWQRPFIRNMYESALAVYGMRLRSADIVRLMWEQCRDVSRLHCSRRE